MTSRLVGVSGKKRHGKDTFAERLTSIHGFTRVAFADPIRDALLALNPYTAVEPDETGIIRDAAGYSLPAGKYRLAFLVKAAGWDAVKATREGRRLLQDFGLGLRDTLHPDVWLDATMAKVDAISGPVVITDVRFPNEVDAVKSHDRGLLVWVVNARIPETGDTHASETSVSIEDADVIVDNSSTIEALHRRADAVLHNDV